MTTGLLSLLRENAVEAYNTRFTGRIFAQNIESVYMKC